MSEYVVSARKYRPTTFKTVVGQEIITTTLKNSIKNKQLAHAYLFCGPRGVGKTTCARIFAKTINCFHPTEDFEPCNECESCKNFNKNALFNIHELDAASNNSVDSIRELINQVRIPPQLGKYSVFIIDEVHMLSKDAFNAFLKTLEEPPSHAIFIMATTEKHKIIPTILSRCQVFDFRRIQLNDIVNHLEYIAQQENIKTEREALVVIAQKADGSMRDALSIFDQMASFCENDLTYEKVIKSLNVLDYDYYFKLTQAFLNNNAPEALVIFNEILLNGFDTQYFIIGLSEHFRNLMLCKDPQTIPLLEVSDNVAIRYQQQANQCSNQFLYQALDISNQIEQQYRTSYNKRFLVELMLYKLSNIFNPSYASPPTSNSSTNQSVSSAAIKPSIQNVNPSNNTSDIPPQPKEYKQINPMPPTPKIKEPTNKNNLKTTLSFSIKNELKNAVSDNDGLNSKFEQSKISPTTNKNFTKEEAFNAWNEYINRQETDIRIKNFYTQNPSYVSWNDKILIIRVLNNSQEHELRKIHDELLHFLKVKLENSSIKIEIEHSTDETKTTRPYTAKEKYLYFVKKYPELGKLKDQLDLDFL
ncbi:MAG: DNA polymerase III subunit gamma/tau [Bacteroidales bacterium]